MDLQAPALNALAPFLALAPSATSPRAAADLITQATSAPNTYVFAELLQQPNIQALKGHEEFGAFIQLLGIFAWETWEGYQASTGLPALNDAQTLKLRLLSLLTIASQPPKQAQASTRLSYASLSIRLGLSSPIDLEHLITTAIYSNLLVATLNPVEQTVSISSVSPLRDIAPGSVGSMIAELDAWSARCGSVLAGLDAEIARVKDEASRRAAREARTERQVKGVMDADGPGKKTRGRPVGGGGNKSIEYDDVDDDEMDVDGSDGAAGAKKGGGAFGGLMNRFGGGGRSAR